MLLKLRRYGRFYCVVTRVVNSWGNFIGNFVGPNARGWFPKEYGTSGPLMLSALWAFVAVGITAMIKMTPPKKPAGFEVVREEEKVDVA